MHEEENKRKMKASMSYSKNKTNRIVEKAKISNFIQIFKRLDSDGDGQISAYRIDISSLETDLLQVLSPLFVEMEELGMSLDQDEFIDAACRLYESVTLPEKSVLTNRKERSRSGSQRAQDRAQREKMEQHQ